TCLPSTLGPYSTSSHLPCHLIRYYGPRQVPSRKFTGVVRRSLPISAGKAHGGNRTHTPTGFPLSLPPLYFGWYCPPGEIRTLRVVVYSHAPSAYGLAGVDSKGERI